MKFRIDILNTYIHAYIQHTTVATINHITLCFGWDLSHVEMDRKYVGRVTCSSRGVKQRCGHGNGSDKKYFTAVVVVLLMHPIGCEPTYLSCLVLYNSNERIIVPIVISASIFVSITQLVINEKLRRNYCWEVKACNINNATIFWSDMNWNDNKTAMHNKK